MATQGQLSNHTLGNKYLLGELLGYGGFGEVYNAQNILLKRPQAIKVILEKHLSDPRFRQRFLREAQTLAALNHPNIVHIDDFELEQERAYLVMPFIGGGTLHTILAQRGRLSLEETIAYLRQICAALDYAHARNVVHLDLKPHNFLHQDGLLLLSDFGLAHLMKQDTVEGGTSLGFGSPLYMAPEQINGQPEARSDIYALGVILYQMLAGRPPFTGPTREAIMLKQMTEPPPPLSAMRPDVPRTLGLVINKALAKNPQDRYATAGALLQAFAAALSSTPPPSVRPRGVSTPAAVKPLRIPAPPPASPMSPTVPNVAPSPISIVPSQQRISRRTVFVGLGLTGLALVVGGVSWFETSHGLRPSGLTPTPTPIPLGTLLYTYRGHSSIVYAVAWSPNGKRIASGRGERSRPEKDHTVQVWDATDGGNVYIYRGHHDVADAVAWSPDGTRIASGSNDKTVQVWDADDGGNVYVYRGHSSWVEAVAWSPDSTRIASASGDSSGQSDNTVQVWDATDGGHVSIYRGHSDIVEAVAWSPDGTRIASGSNDKTVQVWDAVTGDTHLTYKHSDVVETVAWSPDGKRIASGSNDHTVQVWDAVTGNTLLMYSGHSNWVLTVAWSPDGKRIASGGYDHTVRVWDAADGSTVFTYGGHTGAVRAVAWSPDGKDIASGSDDMTVQVWEAG